MKETHAVILFASILLLPVAIYVAGKCSPAIHRASYRLMGLACLGIAAAFFALVGWIFLETGVLVSPGKFRPSTIIDPSASVWIRLFVGAFNAAVGGVLAWTGVAMLRISRKRSGGSSS